MTELLEVKGLQELIKSMQAFPEELAKIGAVAMDASLHVLWENVPPYPPPPKDSTYRRTGTLGKSLGSSEQGGTSGDPSIYKIHSLGGGNFEGQFGSSLSYAQYVIGTGTQAKVHQGRWYTMMTIAAKSADKINEIWQSVGDKLAAFLERKGG